jgi:hypothetical protein
MAGFSQAIVSFGQTATGKSTRLFGRFAWPALNAPCQLSLLCHVLKLVLRSTSEEQGRLILGISCWELYQNQVCSRVELRVFLALSKSNRKCEIGVVHVYCTCTAHVTCSHVLQHRARAKT